MKSDDKKSKKNNRPKQAMEGFTRHRPPSPCDKIKQHIKPLPR
jgi:hypothetical protein